MIEVPMRGFIRTTLINATKWVLSVWIVCEALIAIAKIIVSGIQ